MNQKNLSCIASVVILFFTSFAIGQSDFRNSNWGINGNAVKASEMAKPISEDAVRIVYECNLAKIKGKVIYTFTTSDKLLRAKYLLLPEYINTNFYIKDYTMFQELLIQKYGEPLAEQVSTINNQAISKNEWAAHLESKSLRVETKWSNPNTEILLTLSKIGDKPTIQIDYISKEISALDIKEKKDKIRNFL